jgi:integrase
MPDYRLTRLRNKYAITFTGENGLRRRVSTGESDPVAAARFMDRWIREANRPKDITVAAILQAHLEHLQGKASHAVARHQVKPLEAALGRFLPMQLTKDRIAGYVANRQEAGKRPATIRSEISLLGTALNRAMKDRLIVERPHIAMPMNSAPREAYMTRDEYGRFIAACETPHIRLFAELAIATGARASALLDLEWSRVDLARGTIDLRIQRQARMKGRAVVPITPTLHDALTDAKTLARSPYVIEHAGERVGRVSKGIKATAIRAGLPFVTPHVFRHSAAVWLAEGGHSMDEIAAYLGHSDSRITASVYAKFSPNHLRKLAATLDTGSKAPRITTHKED